MQMVPGPEPTHFFFFSDKDVPCPKQGAHPLFRVFSRHGTPHLLLPSQQRLAARALTLYAAQSLLARVTKQMLGIGLRLGIPLPLPKVELPVDPAGPLTRFCAPYFPPERAAILLGNPAAPGCRFIILGFDEEGEPALIVKAGNTETARSLILREARFLQEVAAFPGMPRWRGTLEDASVAAFAMDFVKGESPRDDSWVPELLSSWINEGEMISFGATEAGRLLGARTPAALREATFHPVLQHGDFAPWNIRACPGGDWTVIDWERGTLRGVPGWDWFHFVAQPAVLVKKESPRQVLRRLRDLMGSTAFQEYASKAGISGMEEPLLIAYVLCCIEIIRQTEGRERLQEILGFLQGHQS